MAEPMLAIGMQTAPRRKIYIYEALASFHRAGFPGPIHVFAEPGSPDLAAYAGYVTTHPADKNYGCFPNWRRAATWLATETTAEWLLVCQDDIEWRDDGWEQVRAAIGQQQGNPDVGVLSFYTSTKMVPVKDQQFALQDEHWREARFHNRAFVGAMALCFPRQAIERLLACDRFKNHPSSRKTDVLVGNAMRHDLKLQVLVHQPSLVQHLGANVSTIGRDRIKGIQWGRRGTAYRPHRDSV